jgi:hypothetical protein
VVLTVTDGVIPIPVTQAFTITVVNVNDPPVALDNTTITDEETPVVVAVLNNDQDTEGDTLRVASVTQGAHGTVVIAADTAVVYTPVAHFSGIDTFTYTASDGHGGFATATVVVTGRALQITTTVLHPGMVGITYNDTLTAIGGRQPYTWSLVGVPPLGMRLDAATGVLSGMPVGAEERPMTVRITDANGKVVEQAVTLTIDPTLTIVTSPLFLWVQGVSDSTRLDVTGGRGGPYTWTVVNGTLPSGITLIPTTGDLMGRSPLVSTTNMLIRVTDRARWTAQKAFTLAVVGLGNIVEPLTTPLNIGDVVRAIHIALRVLPEMTPFERKAGDMNQDGEVNILDAATMVLEILGLRAKMVATTTPAGRAELLLPTVVHGTEDQVVFPLVVTTTEKILAVQFTLRYDPERLKPIALTTTERTNGMQLMYNDLGNGQLRAVLISWSGQTIPPGTGSLIDITFQRLREAAEPTMVRVEELLLVGLDGQIIQPVMTGVETAIGAPLPTAYALGQNYPNPFNSQTVIRYDLPEPGEIRLDILSLSGQVIRRLVQIRQPAGRYQVVWDGCDGAGHPVSSGVYFYRLQAGYFMDTKKMLLIR